MEKQNFVYFKSKSTGKTGWYPASFSKFGDLEEIDPKTGQCVDCAYQPEPAEETFSYLDAVDEDFETER